MGSEFETKVENPHQQGLCGFQRQDQVCFPYQGTQHCKMLTVQSQKPKLKMKLL
jgi:hypothetical protein